MMNGIDAALHWHYKRGFVASLSGTIPYVSTLRLPDITMHDQISQAFHLCISVPPISQTETLSPAQALGPIQQSNTDKYHSALSCWLVLGLNMSRQIQEEYLQLQYQSFHRCHGDVTVMSRWCHGDVTVALYIVQNPSRISSKFLDGKPRHDRTVARGGSRGSI